MTEFHDIESRLRGLASAPVDEALSQRHLASLADVGAIPVTPRRRGRALVMGAVVAGAFVGSATLAGAVTGNLPDAAQDAAHTALAKVGVDVPKGEAKKAEKAGTADADGEKGVERFLEGCTKPDGTAFVGNHGQYVKAHPDDPETADVNERQVAAQSRCGKPIQAGEGGEDADVNAEDEGGKPEDTGRPDSPGKSADHKPEDAGKPDDAGAPDSPGKSADHKPADAGKPADDTDTED